MLDTERQQEWKVVFMTSIQNTSINSLGVTVEIEDTTCLMSVNIINST